MRLFTRKQLTVVLILLATLVGCGFYLWHKLDEGIAELNQAKAARHTTAIVLYKKYVKFDQFDHSYVSSLGDIIEQTPGTEQWRVYYRINNFDQVPEPKRSALMASEQARITKFGERFHFWSKEEKESNREYDAINPGDTLEVTYRYIGDEKEIIGVRKLH